MRLVAMLVALLLASIGLAQRDKDLIQSRDFAQSGRAYTAVHALLIGINQYPNLPNGLQLSHAVDDATAMGEVLRKEYGFADVTVLTNREATLATIRSALSAFADNRRIKPDDMLLIYFSGHGQTVPIASGGAMGFLIPSDAKVDLANPTNSAPYLETCLPMKQVWDYLDLSPAKHAVVIADACFSGLMARTRGIGLTSASLNVLLARRARQVVTAGSSGQKTVERDDLGHGVFTAKLIDELKARAAGRQVFTLTDLFASIQESVTNATNGRQTPQMGNFDSEGEVVFVPTGVAKPVPPKPVPPKAEPPKIEPPKGEPPAKERTEIEPATIGGAVPAGLSKRQGQYYLLLKSILDDGHARFANLAHNKNKVRKSDGNVDEQVYELLKPLPGFIFGGVTSPDDRDAFVYFEGTPVKGMEVFHDYKQAIRALLPGGREQEFDATNWRISNGEYQITLRRELEDTWHIEQVYKQMWLTISKVK